jgi:hypothetical protein
MPDHEQVGECRQHIHLAAILEHAAESGLLKAELTLHHAKGVHNFCADVSLCGLDQVIYSPLWSVG